MPIFIRGEDEEERHITGIQANCTLALEKVELGAILQVALFLVTFQCLVSVHCEEKNFGPKLHTFCCLVKQTLGEWKRKEYEWIKKISDPAVLFFIRVTNACCSVSYAFSWMYNTCR